MNMIFLNPQKTYKKIRKLVGDKQLLKNCIASAKARVSAYAVGVATEIGCSVDMRDEEMV
jgi:ribosomal protein L5